MMDLLFNIIFYGILALIPILIILVVFFNKTKLVGGMASMISNEHQPMANEPYSYKQPEDDLMSDPACSNFSGNLFHDGFDDFLTNPVYSYYPANIYHEDK